MRYKVVVSYDGSNYYGFQRQRNEKTIQGEIEKAIRRMSRFDIGIHASGRTDKGVHAKGQVFHFDCDLPITVDKWQEGLNKRLPLDIRIDKIKLVKDDFHARFDAKSKIYHYWFSKNELTAFNQNYFNYIKNLDFKIMEDCAKVFIGTHDFVSFTPKTEKETIKTIYNIQMKEYKDKVCFVFHGEGFLKYMIRSIIGNLIDCGLYKKNKNDLINMLSENRRTESSRTAEASGLYLYKVNY